MTTKLKQLQKKLSLLEGKLNAAMKLNSKKMALNAIFEISKIEKKIENLKKKEKYSWDQDFHICKNEESGQVYFVNDTACTCPSFKHKSGLINGTCKHIKMRLELAPPEKKIDFDTNALPAGTWAERTEDWLSREFQIFCYTKKLRHGEFHIERASLGFVSESPSDLFARSNRGASSAFKSTRDAVIFLIRYNGFIQSEITELYGHKHDNVVSDDIFWDKEDDLDIHVEESDRKPKKKWLSAEDLIPF